jgi:protein-disulfide reductase (glutathione)
MMKLLIVLAVVLASVGVCLAGESRGFGDDIEWHNDLAKAYAEAKESGKPAMVIIHKTWCGACKRLKPEFAASVQIAEKSKQFVMVNLEDNEEPADEKYRPDGGYIPRILFFDAEHETEIPETHYVGGNPKYKYFYSSHGAVATAMDRALAAFEKK